MYYEYVLNIHILLLFPKEHINFFSNNFQVEKSNSVRYYSPSFMTLPVMASNASSYQFCTHGSKHLAKACCISVAQRQRLCSFLPRKRHLCYSETPSSLRRGWSLFLFWRWRRDKRMKMINKISKILSHQADFFLQIDGFAKGCFQHSVLFQMQ